MARNLKQSNRVIGWIPIQQIERPKKLPINTITMELAMKLKNEELEISDLPPIKVKVNGNGGYQILDGRHRYTALKLVGAKFIRAKFFIR